MADPCSRPNLVEVEFALIQRFCLLSEDQLSYRSVLNLDRLRRHDFFLPPLGKVVGILNSEFFLLLVF